MASKAAVLLYSLAKSQACPDGNKRIALICVVGFLQLNAMELAVSNTEMAERIESIAGSDSGERDGLIEELTTWIGAALRRRIVP